MADQIGREPMLDMFIFETLQLLEQLEQTVLSSEKESGFESSINEIFRIMHTIKGSAAMMMYNNISTVAHSIEDLFYFLREEAPQRVDYEKISDLVFSGIDFIKNEIAKLEAGNEVNGDGGELIASIKAELENLYEANPNTKSAKKNKKSAGEETRQQKFYISSDKNAINNDLNCFKVMIHFDENCEMEDTRAYMIAHSLKDLTSDLYYWPEDLTDDDNSVEVIRKDGFKICLRTELKQRELEDLLNNNAFLKSLEVEEGTFENWCNWLGGQKREINLEEPAVVEQAVAVESTEKANIKQTNIKQNMISVNVTKLDLLMDLVGELVISESMVANNPDLKGLNLNNFHKAARQLQKITTELQDTVMSIRMVPLTVTFQKMQRIVRDMSRKLQKEVELEIIGQETEVDKNIIEHLSDPLMHLIRNSIDHGLESAEERVAAGKNQAGKITLEAKNAGGEVWIIVKDDGRGLSREKILKKAKENGLLTKPEADLSDREVFGFILMAGFSTKEAVTEFSGRGVGMDVVVKNLEKVGGSVQIDSVPKQGTVISLKIPLTLAIIAGMTIKVGNSRYTIPTTAIKESFRVKEEEVIRDPDGNEMLMVRNKCYPVLRLHELFNVSTEITKLPEGIIIMIEQDSRGACLFADELIGEQQVVVKGLPEYIKKVKGIAGCTLLGDGFISLILDTIGLINL